MEFTETDFEVKSEIAEMIQLVYGDSHATG